MLITLVAFGSAAPVVVQDSTGADIDSDFTFEVVDLTCGAGHTLLQLISTVSTSEHITASGEIVYLTSFGEPVITGYTGQCSYDPSSFLAAHDPAGDFQLSDTALVKWHADIYGRHFAVGLDFEKSADSQVLGVTNSCHSGTQSSVQVTNTS